MGSENENPQPAIGEGRKSMGGPSQPAAVLPQVKGSPRRRAVNRPQMTWRAINVERLME
jgi:hypothetical protein